MSEIKKLLIEDLEKLTNKEIGKVYRYIRTALISNIPRYIDPVDFAEIKKENERLKKMVDVYIDAENIANALLNDL